jgi:hypothetical protein
VSGRRDAIVAFASGNLSDSGVVGLKLLLQSRVFDCTSKAKKLRWNYGLLVFL